MIRDLERAHRDLIRIDLTYRARKFKVLLSRTHAVVRNAILSGRLVHVFTVREKPELRDACSVQVSQQPLPPCEEAHWGRRDVEGHPSEQPPQNTTDPSNPRAVRMHLKHLAAWTLK